MRHVKRAAGAGIFAFVLVILFFAAGEEVRAGPYKSPLPLEPADYYMIYGDSSFTNGTDGNLYFCQSYQENYAALNFATVGFRVYLGPDNSCGFVDLALQSNGKYQICEKILAGANVSETQKKDGRQYILWWLDYKKIQTAVVAKYGATSTEAQYICPPLNGTKVISYTIDSIMTSVIYGDWSCTGCEVSSDYSSVVFEGVACAKEGDMLEYWCSLTGQKENDEISASYNKHASVTLSANTPSIRYKQTTYHYKRVGDGKSNGNKIFICKEEKNCGPGYEFVPQYLKDIPTGYEKGGIDGKYYVFEPKDTYAYYNPISYKVTYNGNLSTSGSMTSTTHWYDLESCLSKNTYKREYKVSFDAGEGTTDNDSITASYGFAGWNYHTSSAGVDFSDQEKIINLTSQKGYNINLYAKWDPRGITLPEASREGGYEFMGWSKNNDTPVIFEKNKETLPELKAGDYYIPEKDETLYAVYYAIPPTISGEFEEYQEEFLLSKERILARTDAWDVTGKNIKDRIEIIDLGGLALGKQNLHGHYYVELKVTADNGASNTVIVKKDVARIIIRFISYEDIETLAPDSQWRDPERFEWLKFALQQTEPIMTYEFSAQDMRDIQRYMTTHKPSEESIAWFKEHYSDRKTYENLDSPACRKRTTPYQTTTTYTSDYRKIQTENTVVDIP